jgi:hypothetical protein
MLQESFFKTMALELLVNGLLFDLFKYVGNDAFFPYFL